MAGHLNRAANQPVPGVKRKLWRQDDDHAHLADADFDGTRTKILQRDNYTCRFCSFKAAKYQEIHHLDDNHHNNDESNLLTVCNLCHMVHHVGMFAMNGSGFLAVVPELTQTEVISIVRAIHVASHFADATARAKLTSLFAIFQHRGDILKQCFGKDGVDISNPFNMANVLSMEAADGIYAKRAELLVHLRLIPSKEAFRAGQLEYYAVNNSPVFHPDNWLPFTRQLLYD